MGGNSVIALSAEYDQAATNLDQISKAASEADSLLKGAMPAGAMGVLLGFIFPTVYAGARQVAGSHVQGLAETTSDAAERCRTAKENFRVCDDGIQGDFKVIQREVCGTKVSLKEAK